MINKLITQRTAIGLLAAFMTTGPLNAAERLNYWDRSVQAEESGNLEQALKEIFNFAAEGGDRYLASLRAGWICYQRQDYPQAAKYYETAVQVMPGAITPRLGVAAVAYRQKDWQGVQKAAENALKLDSGNYQAGLYAGEAAFQLRRFADAVRVFSQMQARYPEDTVVTSWLAWSSFYRGDIREARILFSRLLTLDPDYPLASQGLASTSK